VEKLGKTIADDARKAEGKSEIRKRAMTPAEAREQLAIDLLLPADWRRRRACQHPDDARNAEAAALLDRLAVSVSQINDEMIDR
jgi:hypothetical protein